MNFAAFKRKMFPVCCLVDDEVARSTAIAQETVIEIKKNPKKIKYILTGKIENHHQPAQ